MRPARAMKYAHGGRTCSRAPCTGGRAIASAQANTTRSYAIAQPDCLESTFIYSLAKKHVNVSPKSDYGGEPDDDSYRSAFSAIWPWRSATPSAAESCVSTTAITDTLHKFKEFTQKVHTNTFIFCSSRRRTPSARRPPRSPSRLVPITVFP